MNGTQLTLDFDREIVLLSPDEIYRQASQSLLSRIPEDRRLERKTVGVHGKTLGDYFSMWSNTPPDGGIIVIGIEDNGVISGCKSASQKQINHLEKTGDIYCPDARYEHRRVHVINHYGKEDFLIVFRVNFREDKVVKTGSGKAYSRRGDSKRELSHEEIRELQISKREIDFELEPVSFLYPRDFDMSLLKQFLSRVREDKEYPSRLQDQEVLELRHLGAFQEGDFVPNIACFLLFGKDPLLKFPGCKIRFLRFEGEHEGTGEKFNAVKDITLEGPIPILIKGIEGALESQLREFSRLGPDGLFYTAPEYPKAAWYEAIVNACVHRSYGLRNMVTFVKMFDDRLEIESPGAFPPLVTPENIYDMHQPRNPYLMDAMFYLDFVKCAHEGTRRMRDTMLEMKLPQPEFLQEERAHSLVRVTLKNNVKQRRIWVDSSVSSILGESILKDLSEDEKRAINFVAENDSINVSQMQRLTGGAWGPAKKILMGLVERSILEHRKRTDIERDPKACFVMRNGGK